jgi:formate dehydrogenase accessory protein FdhE
MQDHAAFFRDAEPKAREDGILPPDSYDFYKALFDYHSARHVAYAALIPGLAVTIASEPPILGAGSVTLLDGAARALAEGLGGLIGIVARFNAGMNLDALRAAPAEGLAATALDAFLAKNMEPLSKVASDFKVGFDELVFIAMNWLKPFLAAIAESVRERVKYDDWLKPECPVCGYFPDMARITGASEGRRYLHCALCETEWAYPRLQCAICENTDTGTLGFLVEEGKTGHRVDYCNACRGYIKTAVLSKFQEPDAVDLTVENVLTAGLDAAAMEQGYSRP